MSKETNEKTQTTSLGCTKTSERNVPGNGGTGVPLVIEQSQFPNRYWQVIRKILFSFCTKMKQFKDFNPTEPNTE